MTGLGAGAGVLAGVGRVPLIAPLTNRDFRLVWFGESVSLLGDQFNTVALAWLVLGLTGSGFALGIILVAAAIPRGVFLLLGGVLSDRLSPRDIALASNALRAVLTTVVAGLVLGDRIQIWHLVLVGVAFGTVDALFLPAINTLVPRLVAADRLAAANAVLQATGQLVGTVGPAMAGFAVALIGVGAAFVIDAASFAVAALALWFVLVRFGGDAQALGLLYAAYGAGSLTGVLLAGTLPRPRRFGSVVLGLVLLMGVGLGAIGLAPSLAVIGVIVLAIGAINGWVNVVVIAWVQGRADPAMLGRTMSFLMLGSVVAAPLSLALAAVVVDSYATALFIAAGLLVIGAGLVGIASGLPRRMV